MATGTSRHIDSSSLCHRGSTNLPERGKSKSSWRPVREVLNVDSVLSELEQRQQQQQRGSPRCVRRFDHERGLMKEKQKGLMTIYEDDSRLETESQSSQESQRQMMVTRPKGGANVAQRSDNWMIQRTESGYESSDRLSSGSTNPDSPGVENFTGKELKLSQEAQHLRDQGHNNQGDSKMEAVRSPLYHKRDVRRGEERRGEERRGEERRGKAEERKSRGTGEEKQRNRRGKVEEWERRGEEQERRGRAEERNRKGRGEEEERKSRGEEEQGKRRDLGTGGPIYDYLVPRPRQDCQLAWLRLYFTPKLPPEGNFMP
ncbi:hypothetical protein PO909_015152 [Leuciscus waleckii]